MDWRGEAVIGAACLRGRTIAVLEESISKCPSSLVNWMRSGTMSFVEFDVAFELESR